MVFQKIDKQYSQLKRERAMEEKIEMLVNQLSEVMKEVNQIKKAAGKTGAGDAKERVAIESNKVESQLKTMD